LLLATCWGSGDVQYQSDIKDVSIEEAKVTEEGVTFLVANRRDQSILLLRGIVCADRQPGTDVNEPGQGCAEIYLGTKFPQQDSAWSKPQCVELNGKSLRVRLLRIQSVE
jgi:hypothetical protein